ncbi:MAG: U32 family peptidase, partial [Solobacterium sp.]|nr:U32 family peptidase [Solobacterium sp.]
MKKIELLAPAGNYEALIAAVQGGADAIYLGLKNYSARAFAGNFSHDEFIQAINYCHSYGVKVYVTFNTLLNENEFNQMIKEIDFVYHEDVDAILVQDLGLFHYVRQCYPDLEIHCSTQMHVH